MTNKTAKISLHPRKTAFWLSAITIFLLVAHLIGIAMAHIFGGVDHRLVRAIVILFCLDFEGNLPTLFSTCLFLMNALFFLGLWKAKHVTGGPRRIWLFLSGLFVFLAIDESIMIHERLIGPVKQALDVSGFFYYAWVIPYGIGCVLLSIFLIPVFWRIEKKIRFWFGLSAATYLFATICLEMISGKYMTMMNEKIDIVWILIMTLEETLEMLGLIILAYALLLLIRNECNKFLIHIPGTEDSGRHSPNR